MTPHSNTMLWLSRIVAIAIGSVVLCASPCWGDSQCALRRPVAMAVASDGNHLYVANSATGSISVIDLPTRRVIGELAVASRLSDLVALDNATRFVALDDERHELLLLSIAGEKVDVVGRLSVASYPVNVQVSADGSRVFVASLWSHRVTVVENVGSVRPNVAQVIDLPFAPREQCLSPDESLLFVAAAFGGQIAVVDIASGAIRAVREIPGHNLRGLAMDETNSRLLIAHQILHADEETTEGGVHWGGVMSNVIRSIPLHWLADPSSSADFGLYYLGQPNRATGDPADLVVTRDRRRFVAYGGLGEIGVSDVGANVFDHVPVGQRPLALTLGRDERDLFVANSLDDTISIVSIVGEPRVETVRLEILADRERTAAERGERLFYDARLASDGWFSCHGCHTDGHSNGGRSDTLGDGSFGAPKRVSSLLGVGETAPWSWTGKVARLDEQVRKSLETTMRGGPPTDDQVRDLTAYLRSLVPPPSLIQARFGRQLSRDHPERAAAVDRGWDLFQSRSCTACHAPGVFTSDGVYDIGLVDELGRREFNPPSLRGVSHRDRFFHDNRTGSLAEVFAELRHGLDEPLTDQQIEDLVTFLNSL